MPITAQCRSCAARYKIVESAAGRQVKCRRCGKSFQVPGGGEGAAPGLDLRSIAELERTGQVLAATPEADYQQYQAAVAVLKKPAEIDPKDKKDYRSIHDVATPEAKKKFALEAVGGPKKSSGKGGNLVVLGFLVAAGLAVASVFMPAFILVNILIGSAVIIGGTAWGTVIAFKDSVSVGMMYLLVPFYNVYYKKTHPAEITGPVNVTIVGALIIILTCVCYKYADKIHALVG